MCLTWSNYFAQKVVSGRLSAFPSTIELPLPHIFCLFRFLSCLFSSPVHLPACPVCVQAVTARCINRQKHTCVHVCVCLYCLVNHTLYSVPSMSRPALLYLYVFCQTVFIRVLPPACVIYGRHGSTFALTLMDGGT